MTQPSVFIVIECLCCGSLSSLYLSGHGTLDKLLYESSIGLEKNRELLDRLKMNTHNRQT